MAEEKVVTSPPSVLTMLARQLDAAEKMVEERDSELKQAKAKAAQLESRLVEEMQTQQIRSMRVDGVGGFRTEAVVYPNVKDKEVLTKYIQKHKNLAFLYTTSVHGGKLRAFVKELLQDGKPIPPGIEPFTTTEIRRFQ